MRAILMKRFALVKPVIVAILAVVLVLLYHRDRTRPYRDAIESKDISKIRSLFRSRRDVETPIRVGTSSYAVEAPLIVAMDVGDYETIEYLLKLGASPNVTNFEGATPLALVVELPGGDHIRIIRLLCEAGADINQRDSVGNTPLVIAVWYGRPSVVAALLDNHADPNIANSSGMVPRDYVQNINDNESRDAITQLLNRR